MHFEVINVNHAYEELMHHVYEYGAHGTSRNGPVRSLDTPVLVTYTEPTQRVLFDPARDANPFFHLFESIWMLAGRNDVDFVGRYVTRMHTYSDDGKTLNGAYGYRWRRRFGIDQLEQTIMKLQKDPFDRRVVIQMWAVDDLMSKESKDIPCNLCLLPRVVDDPHTGNRVLDLTVINRSNDIVWGMTGANAVHFTILQEYLASRLGLYVGEFHQFSTNAHVYTDVHPPLDHNPTEHDYYNSPGMYAVPLVTDPDMFTQDAKAWCEDPDNYTSRIYSNVIFTNTLMPMHWAWTLAKAKDFEKALKHASMIVAPDWRIAAMQWIERRKAKWTLNT